MLTTARLPDTLYSVRIPHIATYSEEEIAVYGIPMSESVNGKKEYTDDELTLVMLPLTRIIDVYSNGYPIYLIDHDQITEIYKILDDYVNSFGAPEFMLNAPATLEERSLDIDRFAAEVFNINKHTIVNSTVNKPSGFDIGIEKMDLTMPSNVISTGRRGSHRRTHSVSVSDSYSKENPAIAKRLETTYLTNKTNQVDPDKVKRKAKVSRRRKFSRVEEK